jgi:peroxiredoxin
LVEQAGIEGMPTSFLVDRTGRIRYVHQGFHGEKTEAEYREQIGKLLSEKGGADAR